MVENSLDEENKSAVREIHINTTLTSKKIVELIEEYPNLEKITCPYSILERIADRYVEALNKLDIAVELKYNQGKPIYTKEEGLEVINLIKNGKTPLETAKILEIPVKRVYYLKDRFSNKNLKLKKGKKSKYDKKQIKTIKELFKKGINVKEIAKMENIPISTVYYLIKHK
ncbi:MAG: helix-turn-helix domain-containing protein [Methanobrevibacter sp.]|jgi:hypothetical protein|nr:helix-turn-helix domain-containing protein [Methanobrevibacter sp.]